MKKFALTILLFASPAYADIYNCKGIITNLPCPTDSPENKILLKENQTAPLTVADKERQQKQIMLYSFDAYRLASQNEFGIAVDFIAIKNICLSATLAECEKLLHERRAYIEDRKLYITSVRDNKKTDEKKTTNPETGTNNNTNVTIVNDNSLTVNRRVINRIEGRPNPWIDPPSNNNNNPYWTPDYSGYKPIPTPAILENKIIKRDKNNTILPIPNNSTKIR